MRKAVLILSVLVVLLGANCIIQHYVIKGQRWAIENYRKQIDRERNEFAEYERYCDSIIARNDSLWNALKQYW